MDDCKYVTVDVHAEFARRVDDENDRQNVRIDALEKGLREIGKITVNVEVLATNIQAMTDEIKKQGASVFVWALGFVTYCNGCQYNW